MRLKMFLILVTAFNVVGKLKIHGLVYEYSNYYM